MTRSNSSSHRQQMHTLISKYMASGLTQKQFYEQEGLARSTFLYWLNHYRKHKRPDQPAFIPVSLNTPASAPAGCSITFPNNITVHFDSYPEAELLIKLIQSAGA